MGWFDEQIRQRKENDDEIFAEAFAHIADAVMGKQFSREFRGEGKAVWDAVGEILKFYHIKDREVPESVHDINEQLEYLMRPYGIMRRVVTLEKEWYRDAIGAMLGVRKDDGNVVALIPSGFSGYRYYDRASGSYLPVNRKTAELFQAEAICFYRPFPLKKMGISSLMQFIFETLQPVDFVLFGLAALAVTLIGMLMPKLNSVIFSDIVTGDSLQPVLAMAVFLACVTVSMSVFNSVKELLISRIGTKMNLAVEAATMMRILSLPASFFTEYSSGDLFQRSQYIGSMSTLLISTGVSTGLTSIFSLVYLSQIFFYARALVMPALAVILAMLVLGLVSAVIQVRDMKQEMDLQVKESGVCYALISGIQKIKMSGAEKRAFSHWSDIYAQRVALTYNPSPILKMNPVIQLAITLTGTIVMYYAAVESGVSVSDYYAFNTAYGMVSGAFLSLVSIAMTVAQILPILYMAKPILEAVPEISEGKQVVTRLSGGIARNNVSFRYQENMPNVLDNLSLKIRPGQYVAIVGATGCGKSTLMRLLLGFETPQKGAVYYDGKDLSTIDLKSLRYKIGVVTQDGKLFQGDIYSNITICAPWMTLEDAWEAAEMAGIADDIRRMPMGMHTRISEGSGGVSGGQRQRRRII